MATLALRSPAFYVLAAVAGCTHMASSEAERATPKTNSVWLVVHRVEAGSPPEFKRAFLTRGEADAYAGAHQEQQGRLEVILDDPSVNIAVPFEIPATSRANLAARRNRLQHARSSLNQHMRSPKVTLIGLVDEPLSGGRFDEPTRFGVPEEIADAPTCDKCRQAKKPVALVRLSGAEHAVPLPGSIACVYVCTAGSHGYRTSVEWYPSLRPVQMRWRLPDVLCDDYALPEGVQSIYHPEAEQSKFLVADGWKIGGYPCWVNQRRSVTCECGKTPEFVFQVRSFELLGCQFGDGAIVLVFVCPDRSCGRTCVVWQGM